MYTLANAADYLDRNKAPFWRVMKGSNMVADSDDTGNLESSLADFHRQMGYLPAGKYLLQATRRLKDGKGKLAIEFENGQPANEMAVLPVSKNPFGVTDEALSHIQAEAIRQYQYQQTLTKMDNFLDEWPEWKKKIETLWNEDKDGDGTPDIVASMKKLGDGISAAGSIKKAWEGATKLPV